MAAPQKHHELAGNGFGLVHRVAQSPLGELWLALDQRGGPPGEPVLLRYVSLSGGATRDTLERVASAGRAAMSLHSELILPVVDVLQQSPLAVAYEYVEAQPLSVLQSSARARELLFPLGVALRLIIDLLRALQAVHESWPGWPTEAPFGGLLPASVLVARDGRMRLCDALVASSALLQRGFDLSAGELAYRAPEQVYASTAPEPATDVFIAAILLWELISGRRLLSGRKETIERKLLEHDLPRASAELRSDVPLSRKLLELMDRGLSLDPNQRPATPAAFARALERCGHEIASPAEVAAFVNEVAGPQLDRVALIVRLALGYAAGADDAQADTSAQTDLAAAQTGPAAAPADTAAAQTGPAAAQTDNEASRPSLAPPAPREERPSFVEGPSLTGISPAAVPPSGTSELAAAVARALARRQRVAGESSAPAGESAPTARRAPSLGGGAAPPALRSAALAREPAVGSTPRAAPAPSRPSSPLALPALPQRASIPPSPVLQRALADGSSATELEAPPPSSQLDDTTVPGARREPTSVRSYTPTAPVRLAPKRALLAAMASVVLLIQLWMFSLVRSQPRKTEPPPPSTDSLEDETAQHEPLDGKPPANPDR